MAKIPRSVDNGMLLRIRGKGNEALNGNSGDFIIAISVQPHEEYVREGLNIKSERKISFTQAIFGGTCDVETVEGPK
jgi:molecular chaperone DnaJ